MKLEELHSKYKTEYSDKIILIKSGNFYRTYGDNALILWYLFGYKYSNNLVGFPLSNFYLVVGRLNKIGIGVIVVNGINTCTNYEFINVNTYNKYLEDALDKKLVDNKIKEVSDKVKLKIRENTNNYDLIMSFIDTL